MRLQIDPKSVRCLRESVVTKFLNYDFRLVGYFIGLKSNVIRTAQYKTGLYWFVRGLTFSVLSHSSRAAPASRALKNNDVNPIETFCE